MKLTIASILFLLALFRFPGPDSVVLAASPLNALAPEKDQARFDLWGKVRRPTDGPTESLGAYSAGCLKGAVKLPADGEGYSVMRLSRSRYFGHGNLVEYLKELGRGVKEAGLPRMLVGDLGRPRGGPMQTGHASHQSGLDVDIWYRFSRAKPGRRQRERWDSESLVEADGSLKKGWGDSQRKLVALAASSDKVERIFVHAAIKRDLCRAYEGAAWLYKLRPWWGHDDHLHVRLKCPEDSPHCEAQESAQAAGPQCGDELDWWFSAEAREEWDKKKAGFGRVFPDLPEACETLVSDLRGRKKP